MLGESDPQGEEQPRRKTTWPLVVIAVVLAWLLAGCGGRSGRTGELAVLPAWPLVGVSTIGQLDEALDARDLMLGAAARERLDTAA